MAIVMAMATATASVVLDHGRIRRWTRTDLDELFLSRPDVEAQMLRGLSETLAARMIAKEAGREAGTEADNA